MILTLWVGLVCLWLLFAGVAIGVCLWAAELIGFRFLSFGGIVDFGVCFCLVGGFVMFKVLNVTWGVLLGVVCLFLLMCYYCFTVWFALACALWQLFYVEFFVFRFGLFVACAWVAFMRLVWILFIVLVTRFVTPSLVVLIVVFVEIN